MKIALSFPGCHRRGGVERIMLECTNFLAARGHETHVLATEWDAHSLHPHVICHRVRASSDFPLARLWSFRRQAQRELQRLPEIEVVGAFGVISPPGVCWVQSVHAAWIEISRARRSFQGRMKQKVNPIHPYLLHLERQYFGTRQYRKLIALTPDVKADLMRFYDVPEADIVLIPNGFAPQEFNSERRATEREIKRRELGYHNEHKVVIFVANELERKGFGPLLRAVAALKNPDLRLLAVGRLSGESYAGEIARLGMAGKVIFTGPTSDVAAFYAAADVFALPTQYEAWGLVIVEAMACGLPVLTSRLAGAAVAVKEGENGLLLDEPDDESEVARKLESLLAGQHQTMPWISASVAHYAWDKVLLDYERVLSEVTCS